MQRSIGMRAGFIVLALVGVLAYVVSAATTYADPNGRFSFTVPDGYVQRVRAGTDVSYRSSNTQTSTVDITVIAQAPDPIPTADSIAMNTLKGLNPPAYTPSMTGIQSTLLGGQPARKFDYFTMLEGVSARTHTLQVVATTTKAAYVLVFSAADVDYDRMLNDTAIILGSFTFGSAGGTGSVTTGGSVITGGSATGATSTATSIPPTPAATALTVPLTPTQAGSFAMNNPGPTLSPDLAPPPPITTPMPAPTPVFTISTPTPVVAPGTVVTGSFATDSSSIPATSGTSGANLAPPITTPMPGTAPAFTISTPTAVIVGGYGTTPVAGTGAPPTGKDAGTGNGYPGPLPTPDYSSNGD